MLFLYKNYVGNSRHIIKYTGRIYSKYIFQVPPETINGRILEAMPEAFQPIRLE